MQPYSLSHIYSQLAKVTPNMVLYLPRTSDLTQIAAKVDEGEQAQVIHYNQNGASRALCAYLGDWKIIQH